MASIFHAFKRLAHFCVMAAMLGAPAYSHGADSPKKILSQDIAPSFRLTEDQVTLPLVMVRGFPFIEVEIAGVKGKLMLDTGAQDALSLNDHKLPLTGGIALGGGAVGSGQTFTEMLRDQIGDVKLAGYKTYTGITSVRSSNADFLEKVTPDFLGWIGYNFWAGYAMKIDYDAKTAIFYKDDASGAAQARYLSGETLIAKIPFETRKLPNHPIIHVKIGTFDLLGAFDTGTNGDLYIEDKTRQAMVANNNLVAVGMEDGDEFFDVQGVDVFKDRQYTIRRIEVLPSPFPAARPLGLDAPDVITFGYAFLKDFKTVWDFQRKQICVLAPR